MKNNQTSVIINLKDKIISLPWPKSKWWLGEMKNWKPTVNKDLAASRLVKKSNKSQQPCGKKQREILPSCYPFRLRPGQVFLRFFILSRKRLLHVGIHYILDRYETKTCFTFSVYFKRIHWWPKFLRAQWFHIAVEPLIALFLTKDWIVITQL